MKQSRTETYYPKISGHTIIYLLLLLPFFTIYPSIGPINVRLETIFYMVFIFLVLKSFLVTHKVPRFSISYFLFIILVLFSILNAYTRVDVIVGCRTLFSLSLVYLSFFYFSKIETDTSQFLRHFFKLTNVISIVLAILGTIVFINYNVDIDGNDYYTLTNPFKRALFCLIHHESRGRHIWASMLVFMMLVQLAQYFKFKKKANLAIFSALVIVQVLLSVRSALLGALASCVLVFVIHSGKKFKVKHIVVFFGIFISIAYGFKEIKSRNFHIQRIQESIPALEVFIVSDIEAFNFSTIGQRVQAVLITIKHWPGLSLRKKLIGDGFGSFKKYSKWEIHSHNSYIEFLFNFGLLGSFSFFFFLATSIRSLLQIYHKVNESNQIIILVIIGFIICLTISSLVGPYFLSSTALFPFYFLLGLGYALHSHHYTKSPS